MKNTSTTTAGTNDRNTENDAKAQSGSRYYCNKCGTVTYSESLAPKCRNCGGWL